MTKQATFSMNCFWGPQKFFSQLLGVIHTTVGYSGGTKEHPTYISLGDHTETLEITYDDEKISYEKLLDGFFSQHDPAAEQTTQYKSIIFYHDDEQKRVAEEKKAQWEKETGRVALTEILFAEVFYPAEEYHQHYLEKAGA